MEIVDFGPHIQLRELIDDVDVMGLEIDKELILLYRQQIEVLSFPIPPITEIFARCGVLYLMISPCVLAFCKTLSQLSRL